MQSTPNEWRNLAIILTIGLITLCYSLASIDSAIDNAREDSKKWEFQSSEVCRKLSHSEIKDSIIEEAFTVCKKNFPILSPETK